MGNLSDIAQGVSALETLRAGTGILTSMQAVTPTAVIATVDGLTTGIIPTIATRVNVTSSVNTKLVTLPAPTPGAKLTIFCAANGYSLQSSAPATVGINTAAGAALRIIVAAGDLIVAECTTATNWAIVKIGDDAVVEPTAIVATVDGLTTGIIPITATRIDVTSSVNTKLVTLPAPVPGAKLTIFCAANGYNLQSTAPATVGINAGVGGAVKLAVAANDLLVAECTTATNWAIIKIGADGTVASAGPAA